MLNKTTKYLILVSFICLSIIACTSEQTKKKNINEQSSQSAGNKGIISATNLAAQEKLLEKDSLNIELRLSLAENYYKNKEYYKAINHFEKVYEIDKKNLTALISIGNINYDTQQNKKAIEFYEKALELESDNLDVRCDMATCYSKIGMIEKAIEINRENIEMNYDHAQSHHNLAIFLKQTGNTQEADEEVKIYNKIISGQR